MRRRVLVVDDDRDHAESVADLLELDGFDIELAFNGEQAIASFSRSDFDVTLLDFRMPGMDGIQTLNKCRAIKPDANVVMMTGYRAEQLIADAVKGGALGILHKPFNSEDLMSLIQSG